MKKFDLINPKHVEPGKHIVKSGDGNRLYTVDFRQQHRLTKKEIADLDELLKAYHEALAAVTNALYRVATWATKSPIDGGSFDDLVAMLPDVARALEMAGVTIDETAVNQL